MCVRKLHGEPHGRPDIIRPRIPVATVATVATVAAALAAVLAAGTPARAEGLWDSILERMNVKAAPAAPGPDFVERSRPDPSGLGYLPTATPHKVSPLAVKTPAQIQAEKNALDLAKARQLDPNAGRPAQLAKAAADGSTKGAKPAKPSAASPAAAAPPRAKATAAAKPPAVGD